MFEGLFLMFLGRGAFKSLSERRRSNQAAKKKKEQETKNCEFEKYRARELHRFDYPNGRADMIKEFNVYYEKKNKRAFNLFLFAYFIVLFLICLWLFSL
jgi:hypothetical protein